MAGQRARRGARRLARRARTAGGRHRRGARPQSRSGCRCPTAAAPTAPASTCPPWRSTARRTCPVFSSEEQFRQVVGAHMSFTVAPAVEFARGLPPQLGIAVNPGRRGRHPAAARRRSPSCAAPAAPRWTARPAAAGSGCSNRTGRTSRWTSSPPPPPSSRRRGVVLTARRCLAAIEGDDPVTVRRRRTLPWEAPRRARCPWRPSAGRSAAVPVALAGQPGAAGRRPGPGRRLDAGERAAVLPAAATDAPGTAPGTAARTRR